MNGDKWKTLQHNGPIFPTSYINKGWKVIVSGTEYTLTGLAEEMAYAWAQKHATEYVNDSVFKKNFWRDFKVTLPKELQKTSFPKDWDFKFFIREIEFAKEMKKNRSKAVKLAEKEATAARKAEYGFAILNGKEVGLGNYTVEPAGLFMGRGDHPLRGSWKKEIFPEDITINHSKKLEAPKAPEGHEWAGVVENKNALMVASWKLELTGEPKKILFSATSSVKQASDQKKFDKAIKLAAKLDYINEQVDAKLDSKSPQTRKLATVAKLISQLAIRVGDEKGEDTADTVGASSLRVEHITVDVKANTVEFDFLGKDSVRYHNVVEFNASMVRNMLEVTKGKKATDSLFPRIASTDVNGFFDSIVPGVTAKVFRTAYGSKLLAEELAKEDVSKLSPAKQLQYFTDANLTVAKKLNHQTAVSPAYKESLKNMKAKVAEVKVELKDLKVIVDAELEVAKSLRDDRIKAAKKRWTGEKRKDAVRRAKETFKKKEAALTKKVDRLKTRIENQTAKISMKQKTAGIALGTSLGSYISPRLAYSFCKTNNLDVKKIFTPTLQEKFSWAKNTDKDYYKNYPNVDY